MFFQTFSPSPIFLQFGPLIIRWYGLFFAVAIIVGYLVSRRLWKNNGRGGQEFDQLVFWLIIFGIIGARLLDVLVFELDYFKDHLFDIGKIWQGGLSIQGGLIFGFLVLVYYARKFKDQLGGLLDIFAPAVAIGQAIGRWGNYFNQELFGRPSDLPWGIYIAPSYRPEVFLLNNYFHPVFLYESLGLILTFWLLWKLYKKNYQAGVVFLVYLMMSSILRWSLEFIRIDEQLILFGLRSGMVIALMLVLVSIIGLAKISKSQNLEVKNGL